MDEAAFTGGHRPAATMSRFGGLFVGDVTLPGEKLAGYAEVVRVTSEGRSDKDRTLEKKASKRSPKGRSKAMSDSSTPAERYAIRRHLTGAQQCVAHMTEAATTSDPLKLADAGLSLRKRLRELWRLRKAREDEWAEVLNFLQSALSGAFERFTVVQCNTVARVIEDHLVQGAVDDDQPSKVRRMLREAGLDPWRAISQPEDAK